MPDFPRLLCYVDNLQVLRDRVGDESVDLVNLDPPFDSKRLYNVSFGGEAPTAAFDDTWKWTEETAADLAHVTEKGPPDLPGLLHELRKIAGDGMGAYLVMMSARLLELRRVLTPTGSIYLHCDPAASLYLKAVMDAVFDRDGFLNESIWKRASARSDATRWGPSTTRS
ncbi:MAG: hypothetical protein LBR80_14085 [Deltaproteobacteria bacterium]|jgi:site-specific DNA-methyltransferase (adenine-specific)|nr:hypothetical protein [Deltaproteobacteria bacterium]